jgi:hypothetical protein
LDSEIIWESGKWHVFQESGSYFGKVDGISRKWIVFQKKWHVIRKSSSYSGKVDRISKKVARKRIREVCKGLLRMR